MRDLSYWQMRGYPKGLLIEKPTRKPVAVRTLKAGDFLKMTPAQLEQWLAGMGSKPMEAKRD